MFYSITHGTSFSLTLIIIFFIGKVFLIQYINTLELAMVRNKNQDADFNRKQRRLNRINNSNFDIDIVRFF